MTDEERAAIKARADAATPGPWHVFKKWRVEVWDADDDQVADIGYLGDKDDDMRQQMESDAAFIAHACEDILELVTAYEAAQAKVEAWREIGRAAIAEPFNDGAYQCRWCGLSYVMGPDDATHAPDCPLTTIPARLGEGEPQ